jgi:precorrin-6B methylase 2
MDDALSAARVLTDADNRAWLVGAFIRLAVTGGVNGKDVRVASTEDRAAAAVLAAGGLLSRRGDDFELSAGLELEAGPGLEARAQGMLSSFRQLGTVIGVLDAHDRDGWEAHDDATLIAQGRASALAGTMLAMAAVPTLDGLEERFASGGAFLDVGVGVAALTAAFCAARPGARVVGIDVSPRALGLARDTVDAAGCFDRVELRLQGVQDLDDTNRFDLAWLPSPFIPSEVIRPALDRLFTAIRVGGWIVVGAGRFNQNDELGTAVTRWKTIRAGGTPLPRDEARTLLEQAGFADFRDLPTPPGAPALYAARRP